MAELNSFLDAVPAVYIGRATGKVEKPAQLHLRTYPCDSWPLAPVGKASLIQYKSCKYACVAIVVAHAGVMTVTYQSIAVYPCHVFAVSILVVIG